MPPGVKLTSRSIFNALFDQLPADALIDTGPSSLKEELLLEAAGMLQGSTAVAKTGLASTAAVAGDLLLDDLDGESGMTVSANGLHEARPAPASPSALVGRVDDEETSARAGDGGGAAAQPRDGRLTAPRARGAPVELQMEVDADDAAVREAMRYATLMARNAAASSSPASSSVADPTSGNLGSRGRGADANSRLGASGGAMAATPTRQSFSSVAGGPHGAGRAGPSSRSDPGFSAKGDDRVASTGGTAGPSADHRTQQHGAIITAAEQLQLMPPGLDRVYTGVCAMYRHAKGFGFIAPDIGGPDIYFMKDGVSFAFTRLALRAFYLTHEMPVPPSVAAAYIAPSPIAADKTASAATADGAVLPPQEPALATDRAAERSDASATGNRSHPPESDRATSTIAGGHRAQRTESTQQLLLPPTTEEELTTAEKAAALLTTDVAQLLQFQVDQGCCGGMRVGDAMSFVVSKNKAAARGGGGRLLRAEHIRGLASNHYATPLEQSWFSPLFPTAVGAKNQSHGYGSAGNYHPGGSGGGDAQKQQRQQSAVAEGDGVAAVSLLQRYTGSVRTYDAEEQRGHIICDEGDGSAPDVVFYSYAVLWDMERCPASRRQIKERMRVAYSVSGVERNGKYIASLISTPFGEPFREDNMELAENVVPYMVREGGGPGGARRRGRGDDAEGGPGMGGGGGPVALGELDSSVRSAGVGMGGGEAKRSKAEADEVLLLFEEGDYAMI